MLVPNLETVGPDLLAHVATVGGGWRGVQGKPPVSLIGCGRVHFCIH